MEEFAPTITIAVQNTHNPSIITFIQ